MSKWRHGGGVRCRSDDTEGEIISSFHSQRTVPSSFFEDVLQQVEDQVKRLSDKIENRRRRGMCESVVEVILSLNMKDGKGEEIEKEMTNAERLINVMEREYNVFIEQSAAVASVVARVETRWRREA